jgi:hypothetical protein
MLTGTALIRATARGGPPRERHMTIYSPEFAAYWQSEPSAPGDTRASGRDNVEASPKENLSTAQELALEELAERVLAARSIL